MRIRGAARRVGITCAALAILTLAAGLLGGCIPVVVDKEGTIRLAPSDPHPAGTPSANGDSTPTVMPVGAVLKSGPWEVTVVRAKTSPKGPGGARAASGKTFLLIETVFKNTQMSTALLVSPKAASLESASGKTYAEWGTDSGYNGRGMREIGPRLGGTTTWAYQVPKGSSGYVFTFAPKVDGKRTKLQWSVP